MEPRLRDLRIRFLLRQLRYDPAETAEAIMVWSEPRRGHYWIGSHLRPPPDWTMPQVHASDNRATPQPYGNL